MSIEFKENEVCYADGRQWFAKEMYNDRLFDDHGCAVSVKYLIDRGDFQLNEPCTGDYLPKSELDTEQKYNNAVEVFGLFGAKGGFTVGDYERLELLDGGIYESLVFHEVEGSMCLGVARIEKNYLHQSRLTYNQLMAIGKLKRLMNERTINRAVKSTINTELDKPLTISANKYEREISDRQGNTATVDVYDVLKAFEVTCPATQHAVKKLLCSGIRGHKDLSTDLIEAKESIVRAIELNG